MTTREKRNTPRWDDKTTHTPRTAKGNRLLRERHKK